MNKLIVTGVFLTSIFTLAFESMAMSMTGPAIGQEEQRSPVLLPMEHSMCLNAHMDGMITRCAEGTEFYIDAAGRCGCLARTDVIDQNICDRALIGCNEDAGQVFSQLYQYHNMCGMIQKTPMGCGCYATNSGVHATVGAR